MVFPPVVQKGAKFVVKPTGPKVQPQKKAESSSSDSSSSDEEPPKKQPPKPTTPKTGIFYCTLGVEVQTQKMSEEE